MKTIKTYMVRKPSDIEEVRNLTQKYANRAEEVVITKTIHLSPAWYQAVCRRLLVKPTSRKFESLSSYQ